jgi:hypothetical protein
MNYGPRLVVAGAFTSVHEAELARSVLEAAGIESALANEHLVSMNWLYSNAVGGVQVLISEDRFEEGRSLLESHAAVMDDARESAGDQAVDGGIGATCERCGSTEFESALPGKRFAIFSWLIVGVPLGIPTRRRYCRRCGARATDNRVSD